jgi:hypothetical protein
MNWNTFAWKAIEPRAARWRRRDLLTGAAATIGVGALASRRRSAASAAKDADFRSSIESLGEPASGSASADNFVTNEDSIASVLDRLAEVPRGLAYLGVGPDQNFSLIAASKPAQALILDFRKKNQLLHLMHKALVEMSADRFEYLRRFWARDVPADEALKGDAKRLVSAFAAAESQPKRLAESQAEVRRFLHVEGFHDEADFEEIRRMQSRLAGPGPEARFLALRMYPTMGRLIAERTRSGRPGHWLADDSLFEVVRGLHLDDAILPVVADWAGDRAMKAVADHAKGTKMQVGVVYVSDVEFFLFRGGLFDRYVANLARLPIHPRAVIVRTSTREIDHPERIAGASSTTIARNLGGFLEAARNGRIRRWEDLFGIGDKIGP